jgi:small subunit ribosomal protein S7
MSSFDPSLFSSNKNILSLILLKKFLKLLTKKGKQIKAEKLLKAVFLRISLRKQSPFFTFILAINNVKPALELRSIKTKGKLFQVPFPIKRSRQISLSIKTIIKTALLTGRNLENSLTDELINSSLRKSQSFKATTTLHKLAFQNRLSTNYRWF